MIKFFKAIIFCLSLVLFIGCSQVLQTVDLQINKEDISRQEMFEVIEKTLTVKEAKQQNIAPYLRKVLQNKRGSEAKAISEKAALTSNFPKDVSQIIYKIGIGDVLTFSRLIENNRSKNDDRTRWPKKIEAGEYKLGVGDTIVLTLMNDHNSFNQMAPIENGSDSQNLTIYSQEKENTISSTSRIGSDGSVLLLTVGRLEANGKSLNELRSEVRNILIRNGVSPQFQLEISEFRSQKAYLTLNQTSKAVILNDQITTLKDILTATSVGFKPGIITRIRLQRSGEEYNMPLRSIFSEDAPIVTINHRDHIFVEDSSATIISTNSTVDSEGNVVFEGVGKLRAAGRSLAELRNTLASSIQKLPDSQNAFQIQITKFASQKASVSIPGGFSGLIQINNSPIALSDALIERGLIVDGDRVTRITLNRQEQNYVFSFADLLHSGSPKVYLNPNDRVSVEYLTYKENKVFILGGVSPQIFKIYPANRETLADVLFTSGGPLSATSAKRSEVYLLRGSNPVVAYHLDAQSPTRLIVADAMELRPNDIIYVAEQPIISFNRTLATIIPLRILLRDIQDENIP